MSFTRFSKILTGLISVSLLKVSLLVATPATFNPWNFNVYTTQGIGTVGTPYENTDFEGVVGSAGSDYFSGFSINTSGTSPLTGAPSLYVGGNLTFSNGQINNGGIEAAGTVNVTNTTVSGALNSGGTVTQTNGQINGNVKTAGAFVGNSPTVQGNVSTGGNFSGTSGSINGNVSAGGTISGTTTISGSALQHQTPATFTPTLSLSQVTSFFQGANTFWGNLTPTLTSSTTSGVITISNALQAGRNILDLTLAQINAATGISFTGNVPSNSFVVINVSGTGAGSQSMSSLTLSGLSGSNLLFNILGSTISNLIINGGNYVSLLAPSTNINFQSGALTGNLVAENLTGAGQVDAGTFSGFAADAPNIPVPEPSTYAILASLLGVVAFVTYRKRANVTG